MRAVILGLGVCLAAWSPLSAAERTYDRGAAPGGGAPAAGPAVEAPPLVIDATNIGPLNDKTPFTEAALRAALPGYTVKIEPYEGEGDITDVAVVRQGKAVAMRIFGTPEASGAAKRAVTVVSVLSGKVLNNVGPVVGTPWAKAKDAFEVKDCSMGFEEYAGTLVCPSGQVVNITYALRGKPSNRPDDQMPSAEELKAFKVVEITWSGMGEQ